MRNTKILLLAFFSLFLGMTCLLSGCVYEDLSHCPRPFYLKVKAINVDNEDITSDGAVQSVVLFFFDEAGNLLRTEELNAAQIAAREPVLVKPSGASKITCVAWGNPSEKDRRDFASITKINDLYVRLVSQNGIAQSPTDLFAGSIAHEIEYGLDKENSTITVEISRRTGEVTITVLGYRAWAERLKSSPLRASQPLTDAIILGTTPDTYIIHDKLDGQLVSYQPKGELQSDGNLIVAPFRVFPTINAQTPLVLDLYANGTKQLSFTESRDGKKYIPQVGRMLNILIDLRTADLNCLVEITPWDVVHQFAIY